MSSRAGVSSPVPMAADKKKSSKKTAASAASAAVVSAAVPGKGGGKGRKRPETSDDEARRQKSSPTGRKSNNKSRRKVVAIPPPDVSAWAAKRKEQLDRAKHLKDQVDRGVITEQHTFVPHLRSSRVANSSSRGRKRTRGSLQQQDQTPRRTKSPHTAGPTVVDNNGRVLLSYITTSSPVEMHWFLDIENVIYCRLHRREMIDN
jgi:hypothetical protein